MFFNSITNIEELRTEHKKLCKQYHPDITTEKCDTTRIMQNINMEYTEQLRKFMISKDNTINEDIENELKIAKNIYVNVYHVIPHVYMNNDGTFQRVYDLHHEKTKIAKNEWDAQNLIKNLKSQKLYNDYLSIKKLNQCDRKGYIYRIEYGNVLLSDLYFKNIPENEQWKSQPVR